jgi:hypothetical protein
MMKCFELTLNYFTVGCFLFAVGMVLTLLHIINVSKETMDGLDTVNGFLLYPAFSAGVLATAFNYYRGRNFWGTVTLG